MHVMGIVKKDYGSVVANINISIEFGTFWLTKIVVDGS